MANYNVIIPARYQSSRLPGKPLINICGLPMIVRTYQQCIKACPKEKVFVATDDDRIRQTCEDYGTQVIMTSPHCLTGTDRVAECAESLGADVFLNVQGDEPVFNPEDLKLLVHSIDQFPNEVINGYCAIKDEEQFRSGNIPKVVFRPDGRLLYMSRAGIPSTKGHEFVKSWRQVCAYAFPKKALKDFSQVTHKTELEKMEDIEILRFLELGWEVRMVEMSDTSIAVDIPDDVLKAEKAYAENNLAL